MSTLKVTNLQVNLVNEPKGKLRAIARVVLNDEFQINQLRVYEGSNGLFLSYPNTSAPGETHYTLACHPVSSELRAHIDNAVLDEYYAKLEEEGSGKNARNESRLRPGHKLNEHFNKHYPDDDEIIFVVGPYVYDYNGTWGGLDGYDSCDAFTDYESAERFAQHNLANTSEEGVYFPIFKVEREEWERSQCECLTDDMVVGIVKKDQMLMRNMKYGRDLDFRYMPKTITGRGEYNQRMAYWGHIDESRSRRGRKLNESEGMDRDDIMRTIRMLARSQGFYGRLLRDIEEMNDDAREDFFTELEDQNFKDSVDMVLFFES